MEIISLFLFYLRIFVHKLFKEKVHFIQLLYLTKTSEKTKN